MDDTVPDESGSFPDRVLGAWEEDTHADFHSRLEALLVDAERGLAYVDQQEKSRLLAGFIAALAIHDVCDISIRQVRDERTLPLRRLEGERLRSAAHRARSTSWERLKEKQSFAAVVWGITANALDARALGERLRPFAGTDEVVDHAAMVETTITKRIDDYVAAYVSADFAALRAAGLDGAAIMVDASVKRARDRQPARYPRLVPFFTAVFWTAVAIGILAIWRGPAGWLYWVRIAVAAVPVLIALKAWSDTLFASRTEIQERISVDGPPRDGLV